MIVRYNNAPLIEAVFEFFFEGAAWSESSLIELDQQFQDEFSGKRDETRGAQFEFQITPAGPTAKAATGVPTYRRWTPDGQRLVQYSAIMCAFNVLRPYAHYFDYVPSMEKLFQAYVKALQPQRILFLGQRYINHISLPSADARPWEYFTVYPRLSESKETPGIFGMQVETERLPHGQVVMNLVFQAAPPGTQGRYLLDLYARTEDRPGIELTWEPVSVWHLEAHQAAKRGFEFALTENARRMLGREEY